jgi:hypothetical protein
MNNDLLDRYLLAVRTFLPRKGQDDILRELSENIRSQMDEKESEIGRPLTQDEQEAVIKAHGHPIVVAARYGRSQYLISPTTFPFYWLAIRIGIVGALIVRTIIAFVTAMSSPDPAHAIIPSLLEVPWVMLPVFAWITAAFAAYELASPSLKLNIKGDWNPKSLPPAQKHRSIVPRTESVAQILFGTAFVSWWLALPASPALVFGHAAEKLAMAPVWSTLYWPIALTLTANVVQAWVNLFHPALTRTRSIVRLATNAIWVGIISFTLGAGKWVALGPAAEPGYSRLVDVLNVSIFYGLLVSVIIAAAALAWECFKELRGWTNPLCSPRSFTLPSV